jgi:AraC-like DNA-binding protein
MNPTILTFCHISCFLSFLCFIIIIAQNKFQIYSKTLMLLSLFSCIIVIGTWTFFQGIIPLLDHAYLWVISFPIDFLPGALMYLYVRSVLEKIKTFRKLDLLHIAPALLHFIELIPFYLLPVKAKQVALTLYILNPKKLSEHAPFILPMDTHIFLKNGLWYFYIALSIRLLIRFYKRNPLWIKRNKHIWYWITRLTGIHTLSIIVSLVGLVFFDKYTYREYSIMPPIVFILTCIILLMFKPKILYGLNNMRINDDTIKMEKNEEVLSKNFELPSLKIKEYKEKIGLLINNEKVFLIKNYSIKEMSNDLDIPVHHLSFVINKEFDTNYASFINNCRIDYIIEHRYDDEWSQFSLEGIGAEAGFNSRNTFFKAFKIKTGETPSEYFRKNTTNNTEN